MKKLTSSILILAVIAGIYGCGDNKTKEKLIGTAVIDSGSAGGASSFLASPDATSMTALYKAAFMGGGAGSFSMSAPARYGAPAAYRAGASADDGVGLGTPDADGAYSVPDALGMTVKVTFKSAGGDAVYMDFTKVFAGQTLFMYRPASLASGVRTTVGGADFNPLALTFPQYVPSIWIKASDREPLGWFPINSLATMEADMAGLGNWMTSASAFPTTMENKVTGPVPGGTLNMTMTTAMPSGRPADAAPVTMTGSGTITFDTGEVWTLSQSMQVGTNGPVGGTMSYTSTTGETGTMTFNANGTMDGVQTLNGATVGTIHINADGTGTYTDKDGKVYAITGAKPA